MRTQLIIVVAILAISSTVALVANATWYEMEWVRKEIKNTTQPEKQPGVSGADGIVVESTASTSDVPEEGYILIDGVLEHLTNQSAFVVDAREQGDFDEGHLRGALFVPAENIFDHANNLMAAGADVADRIIVYCGSNTCEASHQVADTLRRDFGFENVLVYKNGWEEIEASGRFDDYIEVGGAEQ